MSYRGPKGTYDVYPGGREPHERPELWTWVEGIAHDFFRRYNYTEVRLPVFEEAQLFIRSVGEASDIVRKEMFVFHDKGGRELALRPEGTAGAVRAYVEHGLYKLAQPVKIWYFGPMFRHERQQKGRYRQHVQIGAEVLGSADPLVDVEVISLLYAIHQALGVRDEIVYLNNLGDLETRKRYVPELRNYLKEHESELDPDSVSRIETNPLRTFDSKDKNTQALLAEAPRIGDFLSEEATEYFDSVKEALEAVGVPYAIDERLVRGLDYYTLTVFEAKSAALGAQDTVGGGGRYNGLVEELGGPDLPGIGFGSGVERILLAANAPEEGLKLDVFFVTLVPESSLLAFRLAGALRAEGLSCDLDYADRSAKGQFKQADRLGARYAVVIGEEELAAGICSLRDMKTGDQRRVPIADGPQELLEALKV
ncbi:MAG: histidyl-tRNA synthetase [Rubrobacteraceae bacterium]|nr:histidyl-tRNA synthetase [Rubrobacteraceae bacterium]